MGSISIPVKRLSSCRAATPDEPTPIKGSKTKSPGFVASFTKRLSTLIGFCVGWTGFFNLSLPMHMGLSMKLCISFCLVTFQVCPLFHTHTISSQLLRNPALLSFGGELVLLVRVPQTSA